MKKRTLLPILGILLLAHAPSTVHGQELFVGSMIRVRASQPSGTERGWAEGSVDRLTPDTLWYQSGGSVSAMSWDNVDIQRPTFRNHGLSGLAIGAVAGGAVGGLVAYMTFEQTYTPRRTCYSSPQSFAIIPSGLFGTCGGGGGPSNSRGANTVLGVVGGALIGGPLGYFVGRVLGRWETVGLDQITVGPGNLSLSLRVRP